MLKRVSAADGRPLHKLAKGFKSCPEQAAAYGKCITARYLEVEPNMCATEFAAFKSCVQTAVRDRRSRTC